MMYLHLKLAKAV